MVELICGYGSPVGKEDSRKWRALFRRSVGGRSRLDRHHFGWSARQTLLQLVPEPIPLQFKSLAIASIAPAQLEALCPTGEEIALFSTETDRVIDIHVRSLAASISKIFP